MPRGKGQGDNPQNRRSRRPMTAGEKAKQQQKSKETKEKNKAAERRKRGAALLLSLSGRGGGASNAVDVGVEGVPGEATAGGEAGSSLCHQ